MNGLDIGFLMLGAAGALVFAIDYRYKRDRVGAEDPQRSVGPTQHHEDSQ